MTENFTALKPTQTVLLSIIIILCSACLPGRFIAYNFADIKDHKKFPSRDLTSSETKFEFQTTTDGVYPKTVRLGNKEERVPFDEVLIKHKTVAFLIIKNDTIQYEKYFKGYDEGSIIPSFSMAKAVTSILIGCAIDDGFITSIDEPITNYIPELTKNGLDKVKIKHLLQMTSGIKFNESYLNPFGDAASFYYGRNLRKQLLKMKLEKEPGTEFNYISGNTQLLGLVLERALKTQNVTEYFQEKLWTPLNMEYDASWSLDKKKNGLEKTFCCINARARDFAKLGRLYLNHGNWNGQQIVSKKWVEQSTKIDSTEGSSKRYQYQWWLPSESGDFSAEGILGQYIYVNPATNTIIVRMGRNYGQINWIGFFKKLSSYTGKS